VFDLLGASAVALWLTRYRRPLEHEPGPGRSTPGVV